MTAVAARLDLAGSGESRTPGSGARLRRLGELLQAVSPQARLVGGPAGAMVGAVCCDSRRAAPGDLFVALPGEKDDGLRYVGEACARGATAIAIGAAQAGTVEVPAGVALVECPDPRAFVADMAAEFAGHPSRDLSVVAVTGTSGKTTTTYILEAILGAGGHRTGVIGTIEYRWGGRHEAAPLTTPDAIELQSLLARMLREGTTHVAMEASSHALALDRLRSTEVDAAVFTNFSRDHLDYHGDMARYFAAKLRLFREVLPASSKACFAVLNADDPEVRGLAKDLPVPVVTFGEAGDVRCTNVASDLDGTRGTIRFGGESLDFRTGLVGAPHLANVLCASATAWRLGVPLDRIAAGLASLSVVPGRLEAVRAGQPFQVLVDYAHKPDALERTLASLRGLTSGRLVVVFGCGGDRDAGKRPLMGAIAARLADVTILTSDNPRTEEPMAILAAIEDGVRSEGRTRVAQEALGQTGLEEVYGVVPERRAAIRRAIEIAEPGDLVVIAGKGHEDYQIVGGRKLHLDDREEARAALAARGYEREVAAESR